MGVKANVAGKVDAKERRIVETARGKLAIATIVVRADTETASGKTYTDYYPIDFWEPNVPDVAEGDAVEAEFEVRGRAGRSGRIFVGLSGLSMRKAAPQGEGDSAFPVREDEGAQGDDPMPF